MQGYQLEDSGVQWLGKVPKNWKLDRIKDVAIVNPLKNKSIDADELVSVFPMECISNNGEILDRKESRYSDVDKGLNYFENGDVIIAKITPCMENGKGALIEKVPTRVSFGSTEFFVLRPTHKINDKFLFYHTKNYYFRIFLEKNMKGAAGQQRVPPKVIKNCAISFPDLYEQVAITQYLDVTCRKIDEMLRLKKLQLGCIEKYLARRVDELILAKSSGVSVRFSGKDFIGDIPSHYKVSKLKHLTSTIVDGTHFTPTYLDAPEGADIPFLRVTDVQVETIDLGRVKYISPQEHDDLIKRCNPERGDLLLSKNGTIGITKVVDWDWPFSIFVSLCLIKKSDLVDTEYLNYFFQSDLMKYQIHQGSKQITVTNLHLDKIREFQVVYPPKREDQLRVVSKIKAVESIVNKTRENIQKQIDTLVSYQRSLVHECVTGKKRVYFGQEAK